MQQLLSRATDSADSSPLMESTRSVWQRQICLPDLLAEILRLQIAEPALVAGECTLPSQLACISRSLYVVAAQKAVHSTRPE